ncbi:E3 ubiquitin-protein ligase TRIM35-like [Chanodichthys erythropterus]|uniref:E3 ubiquitin-protein ligase TRIM35-like n=1 Tax=Chanodichthys erythropterus TaxID=933992 RepID=UPI00351E80E5
MLKKRKKDMNTLDDMGTQADQTERQIQHEFKKLHFLRIEAEATITALREEVEKKNKMMKDRLEEMNRHISALSHIIKDIEERMKPKALSLIQRCIVEL